jgi:signal transduction histidine kinase
MEKRGFGLRTTIVLTITVVMFVTMLLISFVVLTIARKNILDQKMHTGEVILKSLQRLISPSLREHYDNSNSLQSAIDLYTNDFGLRNVVIIDNSFTILAHKQKQMVGQKSADPDLQQAIYSGETIKKINPSGGKEHLLISAPLYRNNVTTGALQISLPLNDVEESMASFQQVVVVFTITTAFTFIVLGSLLLTRYLINPLEKLIKVTENITEGYFPQKLAPSGRNEIGTLSASLSRMSEKLNEDRKKISQNIQSLEESNRELKKAQDEVFRSEKLASVGKLAAGVAHEIGNPIGIIMGYIEILRQNMNQQEENTDTLQRVENEIMRIDKIIRELLSFSIPSKTTLLPTQINQMIEETASLISHQKAFNTIILEMNLQSGLPYVMADKQQFQQVMINLFINAMDAMPDGGKLIVTTEPYTAANKDTPPSPPDIRIIAEDTGEGIGKEHINRIFDPFYTTKSAGKGTGLGLSVSLRIIESFGGKISVKSSPGKGTAFTIILPAHT